MGKKVITGVTDVPAEELFIASELGPALRYDFDADMFLTQEDFDCYYAKYMGMEGCVARKVIITIEVED